MKFEIEDRYDQRVIFTAEVGSGFNLRNADLHGAKLVNADLSNIDMSHANMECVDLSNARLAGANLSCTNLSHSKLTGADLRTANLYNANLSYARLEGVNLSDADLRVTILKSSNLRRFKSCLWMTLSQNPLEVDGLVQAIRSGKVDGSKYAGECCCLIGTIARIKKVSYFDLEIDSGAPSEQWFAMINEGDKPGDDSAGGFAASKALEWIEEWQDLQPTPQVRRSLMEE